MVVHERDVKEMLKDQEIMTVFEKFQSAHRMTAEAFVRERLLRHADYELPKHSASAVCEGRFVLMAVQRTRELISELNRFLINIHHADCWVRSVNGYGEDDRSSIIWEFAEPLLELSVGRPYSVKNQFVYTTAHLLHQANSQKRRNWKDHLPADKGLSYKVLENLGRDWATFPHFLKALGHLNDLPFTSATRNFRNLIQHQFRVHFDLGLTPCIERTETDAGVTYVFGAILPLELEKLIPRIYRATSESSGRISCLLAITKRAWPGMARQRH